LDQGIEEGADELASRPRRRYVEAGGASFGAIWAAIFRRARHAVAAEHDRASVVLDPVRDGGLDRPVIGGRDAGADAYVQTVIRDDLVRLVPIARFQDIVDYHSTVEDAARTAARAGVRTLVLTHYVPAMAPDQRDEWRARAAAHFGGDIVLADDLTTVEV
jgi:ribonuclease Z